ncbi:MAG: endonuclease III [bacterium]
MLKKRYGLWRGRRDPFRVLVFTVISQRCRDEVTEVVADALLAKFGTPAAIAKAPAKELEKILHRSGFYRQKAQRLRAISELLLKKYRGKVPENIEELLTLPGVGRKTANCVLNYAFGKSAIAVDTHVHRISNRLGWVRTKTPHQTEQALTEIVPRKLWVEMNGLLVDFGKEICRPIRPRCMECPISNYCEFYYVNKT